MCRVRLWGIDAGAIAFVVHVKDARSISCMCSAQQLGLACARLRVSGTHRLACTRVDQVHTRTTTPVGGRHMEIQLSQSTALAPLLLAAATCRAAAPAHASGLGVHAVRCISNDSTGGQHTAAAFLRCSDKPGNQGQLLTRPTTVTITKRPHTSFAQHPPGHYRPVAGRGGITLALAAGAPAALTGHMQPGFGRPLFAPATNISNSGPCARNVTAHALPWSRVRLGETWETFSAAAASQNCTGGGGKQATAGLRPATCMRPLLNKSSTPRRLSTAGSLPPALDVLQGDPSASPTRSAPGPSVPQHGPSGGQVMTLLGAEVSSHEEGPAVRKFDDGLVPAAAVVAQDSRAAAGMCAAGAGESDVQGTPAAAVSASGVAGEHKGAHAPAQTQTQADRESTHQAGVQQAARAAAGGGGQGWAAGERAGAGGGGGGGKQTWESYVRGKEGAWSGLHELLFCVHVLAWLACVLLCCIVTLFVVCSHGIFALV